MTLQLLRRRIDRVDARLLALLELVRRRVCMAMQEQPFSDILIVRVEAT